MIEFTDDELDIIGRALIDYRRGLQEMASHQHTPEWQAWVAREIALTEAAKARELDIWSARGWPNTDTNPLPGNTSAGLAGSDADWVESLSVVEGVGADAYRPSGA